MAFADVTFAAALWRGRGLRWLTATTELPPGLSLTTEAARSPRALAARPAPPRPRRPAGGAPKPAQEAPRAVTGPASNPAGPSPRWRPLAPDALPQGWQSRLSATRPGLVAWTYWDLARDLGARGGDADAEAEGRARRRAFLTRLLRELAHPAGTHTFWPACMPGEAQTALAAHPEAFWSGAAHLGCRAVVVMGSAAVRALGLPERARPLGQFRWRGQLVLVLRELDFLAEDPARFGPTLAFLRQALGPLARATR